MITQQSLFVPEVEVDIEGSNQRYTPKHKLQLVYDTLGVVSLDPTADPAKRVKALYHITEADDCLTTDWIEHCDGFEPKQIFVNPPYDNAHPFVFRLCEYLELQPWAVAITLTHSGLIQTGKSQPLFKKYGRAICLPYRRINFDYPDGMTPKTSNDRNSLWTLWGNERLVKRFKIVYRNQGIVCEL